MFSPHPKLIGGVSLKSYQNFHPVDIPEMKDIIAVFYTKIMSSILEHINKNPQEMQGLIGSEYDELKGSIQNAEKLHQDKQVLWKSKKIRIISSSGGRKPILDFGFWILDCQRNRLVLHCSPSLSINLP